jgi:hypothetical protein
MPESNPYLELQEDYSVLQDNYNKTWDSLDKANAQVELLKKHLSETWKVVDKLEESDLHFRRGLWLAHGHTSALYGDDGEMQCPVCRVDFLRDKPEVLLTALTRTLVLKVSD